MRWSWNVIGLGFNKIAMTYLMLSQLTMDFAAHLIHWKCQSNCKIFLLKIVSFFIFIRWYIWIYYSKHGEEYVVGQEHLYEDPCDEWLDLVNNKLTSPNFPKAYDPLTECKWNLTAPEGYYVTIDFEIIDVSIKLSKLVPFLKVFILNSLILILMVITYQYNRLILMEIKNW